MCNKSFKPLKPQFYGIGEVRGFKFTQIRATNQAFLYEVNTGEQIHYEVFKKAINNRFACESYPTSKAFGLWSWICMTLERALDKFNELNK